MHLPNRAIFYLQRPIYFSWDTWLHGLSRCITNFMWVQVPKCIQAAFWDPQPCVPIEMNGMHATPLHPHASKRGPCRGDACLHLVQLAPKPKLENVRMKSWICLATPRKQLFSQFDKWGSLSVFWLWPALWKCFLNCCAQQQPDFKH